MQRPFILFSIPLALGIILSYFFTFDMVYGLILLAISLLIFSILIIKARFNYPVVFIVFFLLGTILGSSSSKDTSLGSAIGRELILKATVEQVSWVDEEAGKYILHVDSIVEGSSIRRIKEKTVLKLFGDRELRIGDRLTFWARPKEALQNTNPSLFNYKLHLMTNKVYTTINIDEHSIIELDSSHKGLKYSMREAFVGKVEDLFDSHLSRENSSLMKGILLGRYSYLEDEDILKYRELGLAHILAVSGLHIGIISAFLIFFLSNLGVKRRYSLIIVLLIIWFYGYLIGFPPSILRANIMLSISYIAFIFAEPYDSINSLFFSFFVLLLIRPMWIFNLGFQLSFAASFSIIYFTPKIRELLYFYDGKITATLSGLLAVQIGLLPLQAYYFNRIYLISLFSNLILAPFLGLSLIIGTTMLALSYSLAGLNLVVGKVLNLILSLEGLMADLFYDIGIGIIRIHSPNIFEFIIYFTLLLFLFRVIDLKYLDYKVKKVLGVYLLVIVIFNGLFIFTDRTAEIHFIDVGQGDSILIRTRKGNYLVDTGGNIFDSFDIGENITLPYLEKLGIKRLKGVFITHFDLDHSRGLPILMDNLEIDHIFISYEDEESDIFRGIKERSRPYLLLSEKDRIIIDRNSYIEIISPNKDMRYEDLSDNNLSLVFLFSHYGQRILFTGDMEEEAESRLLDKLGGSIDLIKVPHHGSISSSTEELLNITRPKAAVISVGRNNFYGHPSGEVLERYDNMGTEIYRTDIDGMIRVKLYRGKILIRPFLLDKPGIIDFITDNSLIISFYLGIFLAQYILTKIYLTRKERLTPYELC
ncbi:MAG: DNA internalization-related competence protein ComEC/Rec2 [Tissierellaceae bacterium]